jgi:hypothetical protein
MEDVLFNWKVSGSLALPSVETLAIHSENVPKTVVVLWFVGGDDSLRCLLAPGDVSVHIPLVDKEYCAAYPRKHHEKVPPSGFCHLCAAWSTLCANVTDLLTTVFAL